MYVYTFVYDSNKINKQPNQQPNHATTQLIIQSTI